MTGDAFSVSDEFFISDDRAKLDLDLVHGFLTKAYWSAGIPRGRVVKAIAHSLCFGVYRRDASADRQIGFARVVTDFAVRAHLCDVFILEDYRGHGLGRRLIGIVLAHPELQHLRRWSLATKDAHALCRRYGFTPLRAPEMMMERVDPDAYSRPRP